MPFHHRPQLCQTYITYKRDSANVKVIASPGNLPIPYRSPCVWSKLQGLATYVIEDGELFTTSTRAVSDVKAVREEPLDVLVFINDIVNPPTPDNINALQAYDIKTLLWSSREQTLNSLNGA